MKLDRADRRRAEQMYMELMAHESGMRQGWVSFLNI